MYLHHLYALHNMFLPFFMTFLEFSKTLGLPFGKNQKEIAHSGDYETDSASWQVPGAGSHLLRWWPPAHAWLDLSRCLDTSKGLVNEQL